MFQGLLRSTELNYVSECTEWIQVQFPYFQPDLSPLYNTTVSLGHSVNMCAFLDCCVPDDFNCNFTITGTGENYSLVLNKDILSIQNIVVITVPEYNYTCMPSTTNNTYLGISENLLLM